MPKTITLLSTLAVALLLELAGTGCTARMKAALHLDRADRYFDAGQYDQAEIEYKNVLRNDPQIAPAWSRLGIIYFEEGRLREAAQILSRARQLDATNLEVRM
ncbi:MAG TPA: tetratricopeptide repeat protein, partial [Candidatus Binatia bacterium]|nr:tetratricopeptide repeat protein [Candidatus Binatia bacterium]